MTNEDSLFEKKCHVCKKWHIKGYLGYAFYVFFGILLCFVFVKDTRTDLEKYKQVQQQLEKSVDILNENFIHGVMYLNNIVGDQKETLAQIVELKEELQGIKYRMQVVADRRHGFTYQIFE
jgi:hypothetical protein